MRSMMPDTCVPTSTSVTGSMVPVAVMLVDMFCWAAGSLEYSTFVFSPQAVSAAERRNMLMYDVAFIII